MHHSTDAVPPRRAGSTAPTHSAATLSAEAAPGAEIAPPPSTGDRSEALGPDQVSVRTGPPSGLTLDAATPAARTDRPTLAQVASPAEIVHDGAVRDMQWALKRAGFDPGPIDGWFGPRTAKAVRAFQAAHGLPETGVFDAAAWSKLDQVAPPPAPPSPEVAAGLERLKRITPAELAELGRTNKQAFFDILRPAAEESERIYGIPAAVTLAQAALETGWGKHLAANFNLFGMKGRGTAGSGMANTQEYVNGQYVGVRDKFAAFNNFYEAVMHHGANFHNGYYQKAVTNWPNHKNPEQFARDIHGIYATSPVYADSVIGLMRQYKLV